MTHQYVFDYHDGDIYWCTADVGWVTGHSYIVYGPLANGATTLMFEGVPNYPSISRFWEVVDKHKVNIFYTAPTAIRSLMGAGEEPVKKTSRASLRLLGSVGEPINPEAWDWYYRVVGDGRCPIVDTWWQTETGGILITPLPGATALKPGSATLPLLRRRAAGGRRRRRGSRRRLRAAISCIADSWPGQMRTRLSATTSASCRPISWPIRANISPATAAAATRTAITGSPAASTTSSTSPATAGHGRGRERAGRPPKVAEAAVVGYPHDIKGQGIYAYVTLMAGVEPTRGAAQGAGRLGAQGHRRRSPRRRHPFRARPAEDAIGQDHAAHPAQDRRKRVRLARRHLDARRSFRRRRSDPQPRALSNGPQKSNHFGIDPMR